MATLSSGRSLDRTTATSATISSQNTIVRDYGNRKTHHKLEAWYFGPGKRPFKYGVACLICGLIVLVAGLTVLGLRFDGRVLVGSWEGEFIAPCIIILGVLLFAIAAKFFWVARKKSAEARTNISFQPKGFSTISTVNVAFEPDRVRDAKDKYKVQSGTYSERALGSVNNSLATPSGTLDSRVSRTNRMKRSTASLPSLDRERTVGSLPSLDRYPQSTPKKPISKSSDNLAAPPKPMRSLHGSRNQLEGEKGTAKAPSNDEEDADSNNPRCRSESQFSEVPLDDVGETV